MTQEARFNLDLFKRLLARKGWSLYDLANASPSDQTLDRRNLGRIHAGDQRPGKATVKRIADTLALPGVQADDRWLFPDDPPPPAAPSPALPIKPMAVGAAPPPHPFDPWAIALPPVFVGRTGALRDLERAAWDGRGVSLLGEWRIGKTSLLHTWGERARELGFAVRLLSGQGRERQGHRALVDAVVDAVPADPRTAATGTATGAAGERARPEAVDAAADWLGDWCSAQRQTCGGLPPLLPPSPPCNRSAAICARRS